MIFERSLGGSDCNLMDPELLRILVVDDSRIFRSAVETALEGRAGIRVVGSVWNGEKAIEFVRQSPPDLVTLDLNMPGRGGLDTLSDIQEFNASRPDRPKVGVLLVSALTERGAAVTVEGLERGAFDFIKKPDGLDEKANAALLRQQLLEKIDLFAQRRGRPSSTVSTAARASRFSAFSTNRPVSSRRHRFIDGRPRGLGPRAPRPDQASLRPHLHRAALPAGNDEILRGKLGEKVRLSGRRSFGRRAGPAAHGLYRSRRTAHDRTQAR